jgi:hypothetical protein
LKISLTTILKTKSPFLLRIGLSLIPNLFAESPTPRSVGFTLPKIRKNGKHDKISRIWWTLYVQREDLNPGSYTLKRG